MEIRVATLEDANEIFDIYSYYIENSTATFEITQLNSEIMRARIENTLQNFPYLVCEDEGTILGYCYAGRHGEREGFDYNAELAIYIRHGSNGTGVGGLLYHKLLKLLKAQNICNIYALITAENEGSIRFHEKMGFRQVGLLTRTGYKFGQWVGLSWMELRLIETEHPERVIPFPKLEKQMISNILTERG